MNAHKELIHQAQGIAPKPLSPVDEAVSEAGYQVDCLLEHTERLRRRLGPVLTSEIAEADGDQSSAPASSPPPLIGTIKEMTERIKRANAELEVLQRRLAL